MDSIDDLATLSQLDENILLNELKRRYVEKKIYVSIGTEFLSSVHDWVSYGYTCWVIIFILFLRKPVIQMRKIQFTCKQ